MKRATMASQLAQTGRMVKAMRATPTPAVFVTAPQKEESETIQKQKAEIEALKAELNALKTDQVKRAHRSDRVESITVKVIDNLEEFRRKMGLRAQPKKLTITRNRVWITDEFAPTPIDSPARSRNRPGTLPPSL